MAHFKQHTRAPLRARNRFWSGSHDLKIVECRLKTNLARDDRLTSEQEKASQKKCTNSYWKMFFEQITNMSPCLLLLEVMSTNFLSEDLSMKGVAVANLEQLFLETSNRLQIWKSFLTKYDQLTSHFPLFMSSFTPISLISRHVTNSSPLRVKKQGAMYSRRWRAENKKTTSGRKCFRTKMYHVAAQLRLMTPFSKMSARGQSSMFLLPSTVSPDQNGLVLWRTIPVTFGYLLVCARDFNL